MSPKLETQKAIIMCGISITMEDSSVEKETKLQLFKVNMDESQKTSKRKQAEESIHTRISMDTQK